MGYDRANLFINLAGNTIAIQYFSSLFRTSIATLTRVWITNAVRNADEKYCMGFLSAPMLEEG